MSRVVSLVDVNQPEVVRFKGSDGGNDIVAGKLLEFVTDYLPEDVISSFKQANDYVLNDPSHPLHDTLRDLLQARNQAIGVAEKLKIEKCLKEVYIRMMRELTCERMSNAVLHRTVNQLYQQVKSQSYSDTEIAEIINADVRSRSAVKEARECAAVILNYISR